MVITRDISFAGDHPEVGAFGVIAFCLWCGISRGQFYVEVASGRLHPRKVGRRTIIPRSEAERWLADLPAFGAQ